MSYYSYKLIDAVGQTQRGVINLPYESEVSAVMHLEKGGSTIVSIRKLPFGIGQVFKALYNTVKPLPTAEEIIEILENISTMLAAGLPIMTAIRDTMLDSDNNAVVRIGTDITSRMEAGATFSEAIAYYPEVFPNVVLHLATLGEESGNLDKTLKDAADHMQRNRRIRQEVRQGLTYPMFVFTAIGIALFFWISIVVPILTDLFRSMNLELPTITLVIISVSEFILNYFLLVVLAIVLIIALIIISVRTSDEIRYWVHSIMLKLPIFKPVLTSFNLAFITEYLSILVSSGIDILRSLEIMIDAVNNERYKTQLRQIRQNLIRGTTLKQAFREADVFPSFVVRMIGVGEDTGTLSKQLSYVADEYQHRLSSVVKNISKLVEPIAIMIGGGIFIILAIGLFVPVYELIGAATG